MEDSDSGFFATQTIGIIGLGLIGGSYAKGLRRIGAGRIIAVDIDAAALRQAKADGVIDEGYTAGCRALGMADMLIFCTDTHAMIQFVRDNTLFFKSDVLLTDVAGIKGDTARIIRSLLTDTMDFVPCHPMAGREGRGYGMAAAEIFYGANYIIVPCRENKEQHIHTITSMARKLGCAHVVSVTPEEHDRFIAYTSSLPHVLATALVNSEAMNPAVKFFVAGSFRDGTRVADINAPLWTQLFLANKENLLYEIDRFTTSLQEFTSLLETEDRPGMTRFLQQAAKRRRELVHETNSR
jgi:prephenate dehydrogenase